MENLSFVFTVFFMLLGPLKLIPAFARATRGTDAGFKRAVAIRAALIASVLCALIALGGQWLVNRYHISIDALRIAGGLVLLLAGLQLMFQRTRPSSPGTGTPNALQLAASPLAVPGIVTPAGVAAILICVMLAPGFPGMAQTIAVSLAVMMALDFLVMYFIDRVLKMPGMMLVLTVLGSALVFLQVALAIEIILNGLRGLGVVPA